MQVNNPSHNVGFGPISYENKNQLQKMLLRIVKNLVCLYICIAAWRLFWNCLFDKCKLNGKQITLPEAGLVKHACVDQTTPSRKLYARYGRIAGLML